MDNTPKSGAHSSRAGRVERLREQLHIDPS